MALLLAIISFIVVAGLVMLPFVFALGGRRQRIIRQRLESVEKALARDRSSMELELLRNELLSNVPAFNRLLLQFKWALRMREYITQAGLEIRPASLLAISGIFGLAGYFITRQFVIYPLIALVVALAVSALPALYVFLKRSRRMDAFERNFPEALDLLSRAVRAGHAFTTGIEMIAREMPEPVAGEFRIAFEEQNLGLPLKEALLNLTERVPLLDVRFFVTALLIQKESGGNLAEILDNLSHVIRDRFRIYGDVKVKTAQGRLTAGILMGLPPVMGFVLSTINPKYIEPLFLDPMGPVMLAVAAAMQIIGSILLWKIVHIEV